MNVEEIGHLKWEVTDASGRKSIVTKSADKYLGNSPAVRAVLESLGKVHAAPAPKSKPLKGNPVPTKIK